MHILAILGAIVTILVLLKRLADAGIDLAGLNPFLWNRRRKWRNRYEAHPIHSVEDPMEFSALLMLATAKQSGDLSSEQKAGLLAHFRNDFHLDDAAATKLMAASAHLLGNGEELDSKLESLIEKRLQDFSAVQAESVVTLCTSVAALERQATQAQTEFVQRIARSFEARQPRARTANGWG